MSKGVRRPATNSDPRVAARLRIPAKHGAKPLEVTWATVVALVILALIAVLTAVRADIADRVTSPLAEKLAGSDRVAYYVIPEEGEDRNPTFRLAGRDTSLKLISHLVLPADQAFVPEEDYAYGIRLTMTTLEGEVTWTHEVNIRTRQSKDDWDLGRGWRFENAFLLDDPGSEGARPRELTDDRLTRVRLPEGSDGRDRLVHLTFIPREPSTKVQGLARAYIRRQRAVDDRTLRQLSLDPEIAADLVDHLTYREWGQLSEEERLAKLSYVWERLAAEGEVGLDYDLLSIYETGFRLPRHSKTGERVLVVDAARSLAVNVLGPAELTLDVRGAPSLVAGLGVHRYALDGTGESYPSSRSRERSLEVPNGVHTLIIESPRPVELTLEVAEDQAERVWLIEADRPKRVTEDGHEVLEPDVRRIQVAWVGETWKVAPRWAVRGPNDTLSRTFRFDFRVVHPLSSTWWPGRGPIPAVSMCFYDAEGVELDCRDWDGRAAVASQFEGLRLGDERPDADGEIKARWYAVSEPQTLRLVAPVNTAQIEMRAQADQPGQRLIVRGYGYWPEVETTLGEPFRDYLSQMMIWRYPPLDTRTWFPLRPYNYDDLHDDSAIADLLAQVRLQPRGLGDGSGAGRRRWGGDPDVDERLANELAGEDGYDPGPWVTLEPRGIHRRRLILEELDKDVGRALSSRWDGSLFTELWSDRKLTLDFGATGPGAPELHWQVDPRTLGRDMSVRIDGRPYSVQVAETRGRWRLPIETGRHEVELEFDAPNSQYEVWIDRPVLVGSPPVSRRRVVHELTNTLVFPLVKRDVEPLTVNVVVYLARRRERAELAVSVDGGTPKRVTGVPVASLSIADRSYTIDADGASDERDRQVDAREQIRFVDLEARQGIPLDVVTVPITLGPDVVQGNHEVRVDLLDGGRVWLRAFHRGVADRSKSATSWAEASDGFELVPVSEDAEDEP